MNKIIEIIFMIYMLDSESGMLQEQDIFSSRY